MGAPEKKEERAMDDIERIDADETRKKTKSGHALLVCAYDDDAKCETMKLAGSVSLADLVAKLKWVPRDQEIIFYCG
jgi:hypothetical protein